MGILIGTLILRPFFNGNFNRDPNITAFFYGNVNRDPNIKALEKHGSTLCNLQCAGSEVWGDFVSATV